MNPSGNPLRPLPDPRESADFRSAYFPTANGHPAPPADVAEFNPRMTLEFLAAYYEINCLADRLMQVRAEPPSEARQQRERATLQAIDTALRRRDALEDRFAPHGIIAEPVMQNGYAVDIRFTFGNVTGTGQTRNTPRFSSAFITIPLPPGVAAQRQRQRKRAPGRPGPASVSHTVGFPKRLTRVRSRRQPKGVSRRAAAPTKQRPKRPRSPRKR